jgi:hypothetical protein
MLGFLDYWRSDMAFIGNTNTTQGFIPAIDYFSGNGSTVAFTLSRPVASVAQVQANISNVPQNPSSAFSVSGNTITFTSAPPSGTNNIYVYYTSPITQVIAPGQGTVTSESFGTIVNFTTTGNTVLGDASTDTLNVGNGGLVKDASGNVGIGTASPANKLDIVGSPARISNAGTANFATRNSTAGVNWEWGVDGGGNGFIYSGQSSALVFSSNTTERMRIDTSGNLLVGTTAQQTGGNGKLSVAGGSGGVAATLTNNSNGSAYTTEIYNYTTSTGAGTGRYVKFAMGSTPTQTGSIIGDGTNTAFNTSSDYRLKENVEPMAGALALVMQQRPVTWVWKSNGKLGKGFIAHWLQEDGAGECVSGEKDAVDGDGNPDYQGVDTSFLVATLTAAIQEQQAIITSLTDRITALEGAK